MLGNLRKGADPIPDGYLAIRVDRDHEALGNRYILWDHRDDDERAEVIGKYKLDYEKDCAANGPMLEATKVIARKVYRGQSVCLMCWCSGAPTYKPCHAELIKAKIEEILASYKNKP